MRVSGERSSWLTSINSRSRAVIISRTRPAIRLNVSVSLPNSSVVVRGTVTPSSPSPSRVTPSFRTRSGRSIFCKTTCVVSTTPDITSNDRTSSHAWATPGLISP